MRKSSSSKPILNDKHALQDEICRTADTQRQELQTF